MSDIEITYDRVALVVEAKVYGQGPVLLARANGAALGNQEASWVTIPSAQLVPESALTEVEPIVMSAAPRG